MASSKVVMTNPEVGRQQSTIPNEQVWDGAVTNESQDMTISLQDLLTTVTGNDAVETPHQHVARGKRKVLEEPLLDKATLQKQRRMIKNRESAARSRERKQAYTVELEALVTLLEEENARLLQEEADRRRQRFKQLMECLIPVEEKREPRQKLRRVNSSQW